MKESNGTLLQGKQALGEFKRVAKPGGYVVLSGYARLPDVRALHAAAAEAGLDHVKTVNIAAPNAEGSMRCLQHMLGGAGADRFVAAYLCASNLIGQGLIDDEAFLLEEAGRLAAQAVQGGTELLDKIDRLGRRGAGGDPAKLAAVDAAIAAARAAFAEAGKTCAARPALPLSDLDEYGTVLDVTFFGVVKCMRRVSVDAHEKPAWVVVLHVPEAGGAGAGRAALTASRPAAPRPWYTLPLRWAGAAMTLGIFFLLRLGRDTRRLRERCGWYPFDAAAARGAPASLEGMDIPAAGLTEETFARDYVARGRAAVVRGGVSDWPALHEWTLKSLSDAYGGIEVKVQRSHFDTAGRMPLSDYLMRVAASASRPGEGLSLRYAYPRDKVSEVLRAFGLFGAVRRWYGRETFTHALYTNSAHETGRNAWHPPAFLPRRYAYPWTLFCQEDPRDRFFYDFGVYISPAGGLTRLHVDSQTDNVLLLASGVKRFTLVPPALTQLFRNTSAFPDGAAPSFEEELARLPPAAAARLAPHVIRFTARAGDAVYVPRGWMHEVRTEEPSVMVTYNFIPSLGELARACADSLWYGYGGARTVHPKLLLL
eukprot:TRINITY_DN792_c0_g5_i2.p1 TRINITY_DN792_c0_g5~~TRINITY_DN792_c0_g5_i2.p1  ORF type:complete len:596 (+),score=159.97 TRINITY_DN792_c0_g5_i2:240-2027(+)